MKPSASRVLAALRTGPRTTGQLAEAGGVRFGARLEELRNDGYVISEQRVRQGKSLYILVGEPGSAPAWPGPWKLCTHCSFRWEAEGSAPGCPRCEAGAHWLEEWPTRGQRDFAARRVDPMEVARELRHLAAMRADRERRAA